MFRLLWEGFLFVLALGAAVAAIAAAAALTVRIMDWLLG